MDAGVSCGRSSSRTASISAIVMHSTPPGMEPRSPSSPTQSAGFDDGDPVLEIAGAKLGRHREGDRAHPPSRKHREDPLDPVAG